MPPTGNAYDVDWVFSLSSNTHIANDLAWFTTFTPFSTAICTQFHIPPTTDKADFKIVGLGGCHPAGRDLPQSDGERYPEDHCASQCMLRSFARCNILGGGPILDDYKLKTEDGWSLADKNTERTTAIFDSPKVFRLRLKGQTPGQSSLAHHDAVMIYAGLPSSELERWKHYKHSRVGSIVGVTGCTTEGHITEGQHWLEQISLSEVQFLRAHGLSIDTNEDREEGRRILRGLMLREKAPSRSGQLDIGGRYTEDEKRWLKDNWGNEFHFLRAYGLSKDRAAGAETCACIHAG